MRRKPSYSREQRGVVRRIWAMKARLRYVDDKKSVRKLKREIRFLEKELKILTDIRNPWVVNKRRLPYM